MKTFLETPMTPARLLNIKQLLHHPIGCGEAWTRNLAKELLIEVERLYKKEDNDTT